MCHIHTFILTNDTHSFIYSLGKPFVQIINLSRLAGVGEDTFFFIRPPAPPTGLLPFDFSRDRGLPSLSLALQVKGRISQVQWSVDAYNMCHLLPLSGLSKSSLSLVLGKDSSLAAPGGTKDQGPRRASINEP